MKVRVISDMPVYHNGKRYEKGTEFSIAKDFFRTDIFEELVDDTEKEEETETKSKK